MKEKFVQLSRKYEARFFMLSARQAESLKI